MTQVCGEWNGFLESVGIASVIQDCGEWNGFLESIRTCEGLELDVSRIGSGINWDLSGTNWDL